MRPAYTLFALVVGACGCADANLSPVSNQNVLAEIGTIRYAPPPEGVTESTTTAERLAFLEDVSTAMEAVVLAAESADGWAEADAAIQGAVSALPPASRRIGEQIGAVYMIKAYFSDSDLDRTRADVAYRYTTDLVDKRSPEAVVIADALTALSGAVPQSRIRPVARAAAATAEAALARRYDCAGCPPDATVAPPLDAEQGEFAEAVRTLQMLAIR